MTTENQLPYANGCLVRIFDAKNVLGTRLANLTQTRVDALSKYVEETFQEFLDRTILIIDPATEYLFYEPYLQRWIDDRALPAPILNYLQRRLIQRQQLDPSDYLKWKSAHHTLFWNKISNDASSRNRMIGEVFDLELAYRSTVLLPPVPLVRSRRQMEISIQINEVAHAISAGRNAECACYFMIQRNVIDDEELMNGLLKYLSKAPSRIIVLKFKYLNLAGAGGLSQLVAYRDLLQQLSFLKETIKDKVLMVLENGYQTFPSAAVAFDIVSTSMTGYDGDSQYGQGEYGAWFDPEQMVHVPFKDLKKIYRNNRNRLPCAHDICKNIDIANIDPDSWNRLRRKHYVQTMNDYMTMIAKAVRDKRIELATDKLINSDISRLKRLIPRV